MMQQDTQVVNSSYFDVIPSGVIGFIVVIAIVGLAVFFSYYFSKKSVVRRAMNKASATTIAAFLGGETAKITGTVLLGGEPLTAPLSGRKCAYYHVLVEEKTSSGKSTSWRTIIEEESAGNVLLRDGRNYALVNCSAVKSYIVQDKNYSSSFGKDATAALKDYLANHGKDSENFLGMNKTLRYKEGTLAEGEAVAVLGSGEWKRAAELGLPESYGKILVISAPPDDKVYITDDPDMASRPPDGAGGVS